MKRSLNTTTVSDESLARFDEFCSKFVKSNDGTDRPKQIVEERRKEMDPFVAPYPNHYRDKFSTPCADCFSQCIVCHHNPETKLKLLIVGHNPSEHAWSSGNMYSNPTNRMWKILSGNLAVEGNHSGIIDRNMPISQQNLLPIRYGIGFCDIGTEPGNNADSFSKEKLALWRETFFRRIQSHLQRVCKQTHKEKNCDVKCHSPSIILFSGKHQYESLFSTRVKISMGEQTLFPTRWPFSKDSKVFVCSSTSGRCVIKKEELVHQYEEVFTQYRDSTNPLE